MSKPFEINGGLQSDERGRIVFCNDFDMKEVQRFYYIQQDISVVRAWQGHKIERKWFSVVAGRFLIAAVQPDNWSNPSKDLSVQSFLLDAAAPSVLHIPAGYANGIKALEPDSILLIFSDLNMDEAKGDMYRFDPHLWFDFQYNS